MADKVLKPILGGVGTLFGGSTPKVAAPPPLAAPAVMPDKDDAAVLAAKKRKLSEASTRSGRASTILSDGNETLGG